MTKKETFNMHPGNKNKSYFILYFALKLVILTTSKVGCISEIQRKTSFPLVFRSIWINFSRSRIQIYLNSFR